MVSRKRSRSSRIRIGKVSAYLHHGAWWIYYREHGRQVRRRVALDREDAQRIAAQVNAQVMSAAPTPSSFEPIPIQAVAAVPPGFSFEPISVTELRQRFLDFHEHVLNSSLGTVQRYRAATQHLVNFVGQLPRPPLLHEVRPDAFVVYLRTLEVAANGHAHSARRRLRDKGVRFILETCRGMFNFALKRRYLPPYSGNPFSELPLDRMRIEDRKPVYVFTADAELAFFKAAPDWAFPVHFTLAKTGLRVGELVHLLIEDLDLEGGWLRVRNKAELGWRVKTGEERSVPLLPEAVAVLRAVIGRRKCGPVFLREKLADKATVLVGDRRELTRVCEEREQVARREGQPLPRAEAQKIANKVWWDAGVVKGDVVRNSFARVMRAIGRPDATCPKSWRHSFATLLQDANVDPLIRQQTLGHSPTSNNALGMTSRYTHTRPETQREQIERALRLWPESLRYALERLAGNGPAC
jgi:integrase